MFHQVFICDTPQETNLPTGENLIEIGSLEERKPEVNSLEESKPEINSLEENKPEVNSLGVKYIQPNFLDENSQDNMFHQVFICDSLQEKNPGAEKLIEVTGPEEKKPEVNTLEVKYIQADCLEENSQDQMFHQVFICDTPQETNLLSGENLLEVNSLEENKPEVNNLEENKPEVNNLDENKPEVNSLEVKYLQETCLEENSLEVKNLEANSLELNSIKGDSELSEVTKILKDEPEIMKFRPEDFRVIIDQIIAENNAKVDLKQEPLNSEEKKPVSPLLELVPTKNACSQNNYHQEVKLIKGLTMKNSLKTVIKLHAEEYPEKIIKVLQKKSKRLFTKQEQIMDNKQQSLVKNDNKQSQLLNSIDNQENCLFELQDKNVIGFVMSQNDDSEEYIIPDVSHNVVSNTSQDLTKPRITASVTQSPDRGDGSPDRGDGLPDRGDGSPDRGDNLLVRDDNSPYRDDDSPDRDDNSPDRDDDSGSDWEREYLISRKSTASKKGKNYKKKTCYSSAEKDSSSASIEIKARARNNTSLVLNSTASSIAGIEKNNGLNTDIKSCPALKDHTYSTFIGRKTNKSFDSSVVDPSKYSQTNTIKNKTIFDKNFQFTRELNDDKANVGEKRCSAYSLTKSNQIEQVQLDESRRTIQNANIVFYATLILPHNVQIIGQDSVFKGKQTAEALTQHTTLKRPHLRPIKPKPVGWPEKAVKVNKESLIGDVVEGFSAPETDSSSDWEMENITPKNLNFEKKANGGQIIHKTKSETLTVLPEKIKNQELANKTNNKTTFIPPKETNNETTSVPPKETNSTSNSLTPKNHFAVNDSEKVFRKVLFICKKCGKSFDDKMKYCFHVRCTIDGSGCRSKQPHLCDICGKMLSTRAKLRDHKNSHTNARPYKCSSCDKCFNNTVQRYIHYKKVHLNQKNFYLCCYCGIKTTSFPHLLAHEEIHRLPVGVEPPKPFKCLKCGRGYISHFQWQKHQREHKTKKCQKCSKEFLTDGPLRHHMESVHGIVKLFPCTICNKNFKSSSNLKNHKKAHSNVLNFFCDICDKGFKKKHHIEQHMITHSDERPISCEECGERFKRKTHLKQHMASAHGEANRNKKSKKENQ